MLSVYLFSLQIFLLSCPLLDLPQIFRISLLASLLVFENRDPGCITVLLPYHDVTRLQVRNNGKWITVKPVPNAFIVNVGDQIQVLSKAIYKSVEHRVIVNSEKD
ncbi:hypothetical protein GQ457_12G008590 [Hibiscus cannabinus]